MPVIPKGNLLPVEPWNSDSRQAILPMKEMAEQSATYLFDVSWGRAMWETLKTGKHFEKDANGNYVEKSMAKSKIKEIKPPVKPQQYNEGATFMKVDNYKINMPTAENPVIPEYHNKSIDGLLKNNSIERSDTDENRKVYEKLIADIRKDGYRIEFRNKNEMTRERGSVGFEYDNMIEIASGLTYREMNKVLAHEYEAKKRKKRDPNFDHAKAHSLELFKFNELTGGGGADLFKEYYRKAA